MVVADLPNRFQLQGLTRDDGERPDGRRFRLLFSPWFTRESLDSICRIRPVSPGIVALEDEKK